MLNDGEAIDSNGNTNNIESSDVGDGTSSHVGNDQDDDVPAYNATARKKRIVRMALFANVLLLTGQSMFFVLGPRVFLQLDRVMADCPESDYPNESDRQDCISAYAGEFTGYTGSLNAIFEFITAGALGMLSDNFGRKTFCILAAIGIMLDMGALTYAAGGSPGGTTFLFIARATAGALGNQEIHIRSCLADVSTREEKPRVFGLLAMNFGLGLLLSGAIGTALNRVLGDLRSGTAFAVVITFLGVLVLLAMPEPLAQERRESVQWSRANPFGALAFLFKSKSLGLFAVMSLVDKTANSFCFTNMAIYCIAAFGENTPYVLAMMYCGVLVGVVCSVLLPASIHAIGTLNTVKLGYVLTTLGFACVALITPFRIFGYLFAALTIFALGAISGPTQSSVATMCVSEREQGTLQGAVGTLEVLGRVIGPFTGARVWVLAATGEHFAYLWWAGGVLLLPGLLIAFILPCFLPARVLAQLAENGRGNADDLNHRLERTSPPLIIK